LSPLPFDFIQRLNEPAEAELFAGRFILEREAGVGGMGVVYRAVDRESGEPVALKILRRLEPAAVSRFAREAEALWRLEDPHVVRYLAHGESEEGEPYLAMEWVEGESLLGRLERERTAPLAVEDVVRLGLGLSRALAAAHAVGIVHRDVKPSNVLLVNGALSQPKLADFGIARATSTATRTTTQGVVLGTVGYMAPEHARGRPDIDGRADLYSLGCVLFRCLTHSDVFEGSGALTVLAKSVLHEPRRARELRPDVPPELDELVADLLAKERNERPASTTIVTERLTRVLDNLSRFAPGAAFGRYVIERRLGAGGMGQLFLAEDTTLHRRVALKILHRQSPILHEARPLARLNDPNVVTLFDVGEHDGVPFLAMEYVEGKTLRTFIGEASPPTAERLRWMTELGRGLAAVHRAGLVHGDVKPENVMITEAGAVKLLDFGVARSAAAAAPEAPMGTLAYAAPEQRRGAAFDARADQYGWALVAKECLVPLPAGLAPVVERALKEDRDARFSSMDALLSATRPKGRLRAAAWALGAALLVASGALGIVAWRGKPPPPRALAAAPENVIITALPVSVTCTPAAVTAFRQGLQAMREASWIRARRAFESAVQADPGCPEVHVQLVVTGELDGSKASRREQLRRALGFRDALSERDRAVLAAETPRVEPDRPANDEALQRYAEAVKRFPGDAELLVLAAERTLSTAPDRAAIDRAVAWVERATRVDPEYADAWQLQARFFDHIGRHADALRSLDRCLEVAKGATDCMRERMAHLRRQGQCSEAVQEARHFVSWEPQSELAYLDLALALAADGAKRETVAEALSLRWARVPEERKEALRLMETAELAQWEGDFAAAQQNAERLEQWAIAKGAHGFQVRATVLTVESLLEIGDARGAAAAADRFMRRNAAWVQEETSSFQESYAEPRLLGAELEGGRISVAEWRDLGAAWERKQSRRVLPVQTWALRWGNAGPALDGREALAAAPDADASGPAPSMDVDALLGIIDAYTGRIHLQAGDPAGALPSLQHASQSCMSFDFGPLAMRSHWWLGEAQEKLGAPQLACAAYRKVIARWGHAKPVSVVARDAKRRAASLGCKVDSAHGP